MQNGQECKFLISAAKFAFPCTKIPLIITKSSKKTMTRVIVSGIRASGFGEW